MKKIHKNNSRSHLHTFLLFIIPPTDQHCLNPRSIQLYVALAQGQRQRAIEKNKRLTISSQTLFSAAIVQAAIFISIICDKKPTTTTHFLLLMFAEKLHLVALCRKLIQVENTWGFSGLSGGSVCVE